MPDNLSVQEVPIPSPQLMQLRRIEADRVKEEVKVEAGWWPPETRIFEVEQAKNKLQLGELVEVPVEGEGYRLIGRLRGFGEDMEPNVLRPAAANFLEMVTKKWKAEISHWGIIGDIILPITSLYRDESLQKKLQTGVYGYNAVSPRDSSHLAGGAFDISCRSYWIRTPEGLQPIRLWNETRNQFDQRVFDVLDEILALYKGNNYCNWVVENRIDQNIIEPTIYHVCVNPNIVSQSPIC